MSSSNSFQSTNSRILPAGAPAPQFQLAAAPDRNISLSAYRGQPVVLIFYPADWSPVCGDQLALYNEIDSEFEKFNAMLLGISVDGTWCHAAYRQDRKLDITLLADFEPKGAVARMYGAYNSTAGVCERAVFVIDSEQIIRWSYLSPIDVNPGAEGILAALEDISKGSAQ